MGAQAAGREQDDRRAKTSRLVGVELMVADRASKLGMAASLSIPRREVNREIIIGKGALQMNCARSAAALGRALWDSGRHFCFLEGSAPSLPAHHIPYMIEPLLFALCPATQPGRMDEMNPSSTGNSLRSKRIIQILSAFNCRFLGPNTR
jgi:hypothetical protein